MAESAQLRFLRDPEPDKRREELRLFLGPNAAAFLPAYDKMVADANRPAGAKRKLGFYRYGFTTAAFFVGPVWFFYRKLWVWGWSLTGIIVALAWLPLPSRTGLLLSMAMALMAKQIYLNHAIVKIAALREAREPSPEELQAAGGVSKTAGWIGGVVYALIILISLLGILLALKTGQPLPR